MSEGSTWTILPSPASGYDSSLDAVSASSPTDTWAVGGHNVTDTLIEHWNGSHWWIVPSPNGGGNTHNFLTGVSALGTSNVWAVGGLTDLGVPSGTPTEHWDGSRWSVVASPPAAPSQLRTISGLTAGPLFAAGYQDNPSNQERTLILQH